VLDRRATKLDTEVWRKNLWKSLFQKTVKIDESTIFMWIMRVCGQELLVLKELELASLLEY